MADHFGIITPPVPGHIHPFGALGRGLIARGHRVTCFQVADLEAQIRTQGIEFVPIGAADHPRESLPESLAQLSQLHGLAALRFTIRAVERTTEMVLRDAPEKIRAAGVSALLVDQMEPAGGTIAEHLGLRFFTICNALPLNRDRLIPPPFTNWRYRSGALAALRNRAGYAASDRMLRGISRVVARYRKLWNLEPLGSPEQSFSKLAQISQLAREFDYPRTHLPGEFHYVGPLRRDAVAAIPFPWEKLNGKPLIYASLGTLQNRREPVFRCFAEACRGLDVQLVITHGGSLNASQIASLAALPGDPLVVPYAPQLEVLQHAQLTLTHAGLNTVLDSLTHGVPMVAIPITYEQPAIARRVEWTGVGKSLPLARLNAEGLRKIIRELLGEPRYRQAARQMASAIRNAGGVSRAADIIEAAL
jgi:zeaxanthin glucosyltransferase